MSPATCPSLERTATRRTLVECGLLKYTGTAVIRYTPKTWQTLSVGHKQAFLSLAAAIICFRIGNRR